MTAKKKDTEGLTFEESLRRLEEIVEKLEQGNVPLEESIKLYEEGLALSKSCARRLTQAELTIKRLEKDTAGNFKLTDESQ